MTGAAQASSRSEWRVHWKLLVPCLAGILLCATHAYMIGVMIGPLESEFGWSRAEISSGLLINAVIALVLAPFAGMAVDRFGPRRIGLIGVPLYCGAVALLSLTTSDILTWWALWIVVALTNMLVMPMVWTTAINGYFDRNRGKALAIALTGTGIAAAVIPKLTYTLVELLGWRMAFAGVSAIVLVIVYPLVIFMFYGPRDTAMAPALDPGATSTPELKGMPVQEAFRSARFLKLAGGAVIFAVAAAALTFNAVPLVIAQGLSAATAASVAGLVGIGSIIGRLGGGYLLDRFNAGRVAGFGVLIPLIVIAILLAFKGSVPAAAAACFVLGLSVGLEVDGCAYLAARHFGIKSFGTMFGAINGLILFGSGIAPIIANAIFDVTHSYDLFLWLSIPAFLVASVLWLSLGQYPKFAEGTSADEAGAALAQRTPA
ncbi:MFS transporter [Novosphingobium endophyticum]|uniref:MFS transporter n=1 Tax=Novosphingobium endophyticum TaxID=1955250 RepID=UPI00227A4B2E|nr:MFS transporter [Novosphingobium endophyticum]